MVLQSRTRGKNVRTNLRPISLESAIEEVERLVDQEDWEQLMHSDQLRLAQEAREALVGFQEGEMRFPPTFKVARQKGTTYIKRRVPSYCDRILWKSMPTRRKHIRQVSLRAVPSVSTSDHKPILACFEIQQSKKLALTPLTPSSGFPSWPSSGFSSGHLRGVCVCIKKKCVCAK